MTPTTPKAPPASDSFIPRHIGPTPTDTKAMLDVLGYKSLDALIDATVPKRIVMLPVCCVIVAWNSSS